MKGQDAHLRLVFMTGVTKFSKVSLFSGLNQLNDLTLDARFATVCGYTQQDLEQGFGEHLQGVDWDRLKQWYNGYGFLGEPVYNPFDILLFIDKGREYRNYWFETGSPSFLIELLPRRATFLPDLEGAVGRSSGCVPPCVETWVLSEARRGGIVILFQRVVRGSAPRGACPGGRSAVHPAGDVRLAPEFPASQVLA
jgi:hypothetical protein